MLKLDFQVKNTRTQRNSTSIRLNAETLEIKGTQESLGNFLFQLEVELNFTYSLF